MQTKSQILGLLLCFATVCTSAAFQLTCKLDKTTSKQGIGSALRLAATKKKKTLPPRPVYLTHERDLMRQVARLESMDSYVLVSTLTSSMSFGALMGFTPYATSRAAFHVKGQVAKFIYHALCFGIQAVAGLSALCGLYATIVFSLTILYGKSALGVERDVEYDDFLRMTARARVHGFRCFTYSLALFSLLAVLVLLERTSFCAASMPTSCIASIVVFRLYSDWKLLSQSAEQIYRDEE